MADQAQLRRIKAMRFTGDFQINLLQSIADWESTQEYAKVILLITFEEQREGGDSAIVYYEDA